MSLRTPLGKVKGLGSAKSGASHWWMQRLTALALIPLIVWFVVNIIRGAGSEHYVLSFIASPLNAVFTVLFIVTTLYHGMLGIQTVIEDYVHSKPRKLILLISVQFASIVTAIAGVIAVVALHANTMLLQNIIVN